MSDINQTGTSPPTTPRTPDRTSNEDISSDHIHAESETLNNNNTGENGNSVTDTVADAVVHGARDTAVVLHEICLRF